MSACALESEAVVVIEEPAEFLSWLESEQPTEAAYCEFLVEELYEQYA